MQVRNVIEVRAVVSETEDVEQAEDTCSHNQGYDSNQSFNIDARGDSCSVFQWSYVDSLTTSSPGLLANTGDGAPPSDEGDEEQCLAQLTAETVIDAISHSLDLLDKMRGSLNNFETFLMFLCGKFLTKTLLHTRGNG